MEILSRENLMRLTTGWWGKRAHRASTMTVEQLKPYHTEHWPRIREELLAGHCRPAPVRGVKTASPARECANWASRPSWTGSSSRRCIRYYADLRSDFSDPSYGFRPGRSAHDLVLAARSHVAGGRRFLVVLDLEKFSDRVNHDVLMARVAR
ncbi:hypothetical protein [Mesorhizobium sp.]|uniref:hypothetical protein n=1 Tax=Mesorhizobium sp. TaxID=1871066 RepID=UPI0025DFB83D|nr:hypothetical protein [Mesorhizobium sp.]